MWSLRPDVRQYIHGDLCPCLLSFNLMFEMTKYPETVLKINPSYITTNTFIIIKVKISLV